MISSIIVLSGPISCGKSTLAEKLSAHFSAEIFHTRKALEKRHSQMSAGERKSLQEYGERLDAQTDGAWVREELDNWLHEHEKISTVIIDAVRIKKQVEHLRKSYGSRAVQHIHLTADEEELRKRYDQRRKKRTGDTISFSEARSDPTEAQVESLHEIADLVIKTDLCTPRDLFIRITSFLGIGKIGNRGYVDIVIGGQFGSEGKGQIAGYLSREYDLLVRVGGPNAGHTVFAEPEPFVHHQLPSGTGMSDARLLIGPGATIDPGKLLEEVSKYGVNVDRLMIDPQAMIITEAHKEMEKKLVDGISSTGQGVGAAMACRIFKRDDPPALAADERSLKPYLKSALDIIHQMLSEGRKILLEGTQGTGLSLYHGYYPHVTSRDTTVMGCLSEAGISPSRVRRTVMVCRTYPIRVKNSPTGKTSGPMLSKEINWKEVSRRSGLNHKMLLKNEKTTTTKRLRRVSEFNWELLKKASLLNEPTDIALTFTDYISIENVTAMRFEQLTPETRNFIEEVGRVSGANVSLITTGFSSRCIIDRRNW